MSDEAHVDIEACIQVISFTSDAYVAGSILYGVDGRIENGEWSSGSRCGVLEGWRVGEAWNL